MRKSHFCRQRLMTQFPVALFAACCGGCLTLSGPEPIEGTWTGTVISIEAVDSIGGRCSVTGLRLKSGPTVVLPAELGGGLEPLLVKLNGSTYSTIDPSTFPEMGQSVTVEGEMIVAHASSRLAAHGDG